ncbi:sulfatase family protein [Seonamhaeicola maritimus]|uniref:sulfatase family protein n=1 Tax=Seonamhaeicola maritimus TaxID=2591822 RepID=UPI002495466E|nr:sulfatase [Seonamhaeicola maritimus]
MNIAINSQMLFRTILFSLMSVLLLSCNDNNAQEVKKPNILWIIAEDLSPFMGCYGDSINKGHTPIIDKLASNGVLFTRAYASAPVCSASRSAFITGRMQTTIGIHNHRSSRTTDGEVVPEELRIHLPKDIKTIPELMREVGYFTFNSGKDDYNFHYDRRGLYTVGSKKDYVTGMNGWQGNTAINYMSFTDYVWSSRPDKNQAWFGQIQIMGGKKDAKYVREGEKLNDTDVPLPPYYPDTPVQRKSWTLHYNANRGSDVTVENILKQLEADGELENTIIFFFSDHGSPTSLRHKQFCYEGGMKVPLIIKGNSPALNKGTVRNDLVSLLDVSATTLAMGGVQLPQYLDGQDLFSEEYKNQAYVIGARDRCDFTIDRIRTVVSEKYRYIKNYWMDRPVLQPSYRDTHANLRDMKKQHEAGNLTPYQEKFWFGERPSEELYDLDLDPHQMNNLAGNPEFAAVLKEHRSQLDNWIEETGDQGQYQESADQLKATYNLWKEKKQFKEANKVNPEYYQFIESKE